MAGNDDDAELRFLLERLVAEGKSNRLILIYLANLPNNPVNISIRTLKRRLQKWNIKRIDQSITQMDVEREVLAAHVETGTRIGYRTMYKTVRSEGKRVRREAVRRAMQTLGIQRTSINRRKFNCRRGMVNIPGPNFIWSLDGHDKLIRFSILIHGCVDIYSRKIMWLRAFVNNRNSEVVGSMYANAVKEFGVVPKFTQSDHGREATLIHVCQTYFYWDDDEDPARHHRYVYSVQNHTIESFWNGLRDRCTLKWHDVFEALEFDGLWSGHVAERFALVAVYLPLVNASLERFSRIYSIYRIRKQKNKKRPSGQPEDMYLFPSAFGGRECGKIITEDTVNEVCSLAGIRDISLLRALPTDVRETVDRFFRTNRITITNGNARDVYVQLRSLLLDELPHLNIDNYND